MQHEQQPSGPVVIAQPRRHGPLPVLPHAAPGQRVVTRFPPEPSYLLDLGHIKAALTNECLAAAHEGQWILRFDDTNPGACSQANVDAYLQDLPLMGLRPDRVTFASDSFRAMADTATQLVGAGFLYADDLPVEQMRALRLAKQPSPARDAAVAASLAAWAEMQAGSEAGCRFCLRFRLQPESENGALRDPVAWRCIADPPHYRTGQRFKAYPTYDFAVCWLDLAEGVTHALRTLQFRDRDVLYSAVQKAILQIHPEWGPAECHIFEFPRINMAFTPQLKSHQKALIAAGLVEGPSDPRLPTLRGLMRAGCHPQALRAFLLEQLTPASKDTFHSWDKLWTINRRLLDPSAARHMAVDDAGRVLLTLSDGPDAPQEAVVPWKGGHTVRVTHCRQVWLDAEDAQQLAPGDQVTLLAWGAVTVTGVTHEPPLGQQQQQEQQQQQQAADDPGCQANGSSNGNGSSSGGRAQQRVTGLTAVLSPQADVQASVLKAHWLPALGPDQLLPLALVYFSPCCSVERVTQDVDAAACFRPASRREVAAWGDPSLLASASAGPGAVVQLQRKGFFILDQVVRKDDGAAGVASGQQAAGSSVPVVPFGAAAAASGHEQLQRGDVARLVLHHIPDGHTKTHAVRPRV